MATKILIAGGSGFIGSHLRKHLIEAGYEVSILSRGESDGKTFHWDPQKGEIDEEAFDDVSIIINLAGVGIADKRWTTKRKSEIIRSRTQSIELLFEKLQLLRTEKPKREESKDFNRVPKIFISSSAIGVYGDTKEKWVDESSPNGKDFLSTAVEEWELAAHKIELLGMRVVILRTGVVLGKDGGALPVMATPVKLFAGAALGNGQQYMSWIHIDDLCKLFAFAAKTKTMQGVYNSVAPNPVTNKEFTKTLGKILHRPIWPFSVPAFLLKLILGEKASIVLDGQRVSNKKIIAEEFTFQFSDLQAALKDLYETS